MFDALTEWWLVLVASVFMVCLGVRSVYSMFADVTVEGAPPGYVRPDLRGAIAAAVGGIIVAAMIWVAPWFIEVFFVEFLGFLRGDLLVILVFVHASVSVVFALMGLYVKYIAKDPMDWAFSGDGERTTRSVVYTVAGAMLGCVAASMFAVV